MDKLEFIKPDVLDVQFMQDLVYEDVENGNILDRNSNEMATTIRSYTVVKLDDQFIGFVAVHIHTVELAEIRSLVVKKEFRGKNIAKLLIEKAIFEARNLNLKTLLVLTYKKELFEHFEFVEIEKASLPDTKIWADCIKCKHFPICDEIALTLELA